MTTIVGIANLTADSFSDGGRYLNEAAARARVTQLVAEGADIVELGPASSHPDAARVDASEQIRRLRWVLDALSELGLGLERVSVDATTPAVVAHVLGAGVGYINDIRGFADEQLYPELAAANARLVVMHSIGNDEIAQRADLAPDAILERITDFFDLRVETLVAAGIRRERLILDPGMGFFLGTNPDTSFTVLRELDRLRKRYALPLLLSVTRKSFLQRTVGRDAAGSAAATLAAELACIGLGADYLRTHDVAQLVDGRAVWSRLGVSSLNLAR